MPQLDDLQEEHFEVLGDQEPVEGGVPAVEVGDQGDEAKGEVTSGEVEESPVGAVQFEECADVVKVDEKSV